MAVSCTGGIWNIVKVFDIKELGTSDIKKAIYKRWPILLGNSFNK